MITQKTILAIQKSHGARCPVCQTVCEIHNFSTGGYHFEGGEVWDDVCEDFRCWCPKCEMYIENPIEEEESPDENFDVPF